ncbi:hypothetical protein [Arsenicibacter rosenii]|uniref:Uncharacterized protein n=1 Tax=Arsenicibacter rosenii TaxID=1750698 RepID=A0A1S2VQW3_9BACT|nr:hypothetical protein [Arsenicibacter rosenii]OIN61177.1 hypothetical protein BLX24_03715 [Arsenicibacter rosenii]
MNQNPTPDPVKSLRRDIIRSAAQAKIGALLVLLKRYEDNWIKQTTAEGYVWHASDSRAIGNALKGEYYDKYSSAATKELLVQELGLASDPTRDFIFSAINSEEYSEIKSRLNSMAEELIKLAALL